jgi:hypothetical protein
MLAWGMVPPVEALVTVVPTAKTGASRSAELGEGRLARASVSWRAGRTSPAASSAEGSASTDACSAGAGHSSRRSMPGLVAGPFGSGAVTTWPRKWWAMRQEMGWLALGASAAGYPLTEALVERAGRAGALAVEVACAGLVARDAAMVAKGVPGRLRLLPAILLYCELASGVMAAAATSRLLRHEHAIPSRRDSLELFRRVSTAALFALHTVRFHIYLQPDRGLRPVQHR